MQTVYVLNSSFECISQTSVGRAITLLYQRKAEVVRWGEGVMRSMSGTFRVPLIIRIFRYVRTFGRSLRYSNRITWERDFHTCQYCGKKITVRSDLTTDHVIPASRGGKTIYENMVTCCGACNRKKDDRTPAEAGMRLRRKPFRPPISRHLTDVIAEARELMLQGKWAGADE